VFFPPLPAWNEFHPLVIHFPIALLIVAPLFALLAVFLRSGRRWLGLSALLLMALGTVAAFVAVETGEAAAAAHHFTPRVEAVVEQHEELGETVRDLFTGLTVVYAAVLLLPPAVRRFEGQAATLVLNGVFLLAYAVCLVVLANAADLGGQLVHRYGVRGIISADAPSGDHGEKVPVALAPSDGGGAASVP